ncbi:MAG: alpha/beta fold hydrolase [Polyangiales bacterium]
MDIHEVAVTGANGFIGRFLLVELTRRGALVWALMRRAEERVDELRAWVDARGGDGRLVRATEFDLAAPDLGLTPEGEQVLACVDAVYHLAARFEFGLSVEVARQANVDASLRLVERLAQRPPGARVRRLVHLSGYRTEGTPARALDVTDARGLAAFYRTHGAYEASKMEAHQRVERRARELDVPLTRVSPAVVIGHSETGETTQFIGLAETLRRLRDGQLMALPGSDQTWLPLVPVDHLAACLAGVPGDRASEGQHLVVFDEASPSLTQLVALAAARLGTHAPRRHVPVRLVRALPTRLTGVDHEALSFLSDDRYDSQPLSAFERRVGLSRPPIEQAFLRWVDFLQQTEFGARPHDERTRLLAAGVSVSASGDLRAADSVLLHGLLLNDTSWAALRERLPFPSLAVDLPGLGRSGAGGGQPGEWLRAVLAPLATKPLLVAHSLGAVHALELAQRYPERIAGLVLVSPFFLQARPAPLLRVGWLVQRALRWLRRLGPSRALGDAALPALTDDAVDLLTRPEVARASARWLSWVARHDVRARLRQTLDELQLPVVLVHGERDPLRVAPGTPRETHVVHGAGHYPQLTHPERVAGVIRAAHARHVMPSSVT